MYILIDRDRMVLLHKHRDIHAIANVAWIECRQAAYCIFNIADAIALKTFTDMELGMLYRNITNKDPSLKRVQVLQVLHDVIVRIPTSDIDLLESDRQAALIKEEDERKWVYVRRAARPAVKADLFEHPYKTAQEREEDVQNAKANKLPALTAKRASPTVTTPRPTPVVNAKVAGNPTSAPKRGTAKAIIWEYADAMWEAAGKPTAKQEVLAVRKEVMGKLETEEAIKRASSSSELGNWHKARVPV